MPLNPVAAGARVAGYGSLSAAVFLLGIASSFVIPYLSLFGANEAGMSPLALGAFMTSLSVSGIVLSSVIGRWSDRRGDRRLVVALALAAAACGYALLAVTREYALLVLVATTFLGAGAAAYPQLFALARTQIRGADASSAGRGVVALRSVFSMAWVVGPPAGAAILARADFAGLFAAAAAAYGLAAVPALLVRPRTPAAAPPSRASLLPAPGSGRPVLPIALCFALYGMAGSMGGIALPILVTRALGGSTGDVGLMLGLGALLEIPLMLTLALAPRRASSERLLAFAFALFALYFAVVASAGGIAALLLVQAFRAVVVAITAALGLAYFQELMPDRIGAATTLFANTINAGQMLAGIGFGVVAQAFGVRAVFVACAVVAGLACALLVAVTRRPVGRRSATTS